jgi:signal peptidase I
LIIDEFSYHFRTPERGEVVVFRYPKDPSKFFIKRVIGLPGETVRIENNEVLIIEHTGAEISLSEPYLAKPVNYRPTTVTLKPNEYFVMGDNRNMSLDSRIWGPVTINHIKGRVGARLFPIATANILPGDYRGSLVENN